MNIYLIRNIYNNECTIGDLVIDHKIFCHTLEDVVRPCESKKIPGKTAIKAGRYQIMITYSERFNRNVPVLIGVPGFSGIRIHGGNKAGDTDGCILVAKQIINDKTIQGTMEKELTLLLNKSFENNYIEIINTWPYVGVNN